MMRRIKSKSLKRQNCLISNIHAWHSIMSTYIHHAQIIEIGIIYNYPQYFQICQQELTMPLGNTSP